MNKRKRTPGRAGTAQRQQEILEAALKVFSQKGFKGATTKEIAAEAGISEGTIFRYFKTKKDILFGLLEPYIVKTLSDTIEQASGENDEVVLKAIMKNRLKLIRENISLIRVLFTEAQFHPELREQFVQKVIMRAAGILEQYIGQRVRTGEFRDIDPGIAARAFVGMVGVFVVWKEFLQADKYVSFDEDIVVDELVKIFLNGMRNKRAEGENVDEKDRT